MNPPEEFCRLCLRVDGVVSVFSYDCLNSWSLCDRIFECVSVKIQEDDVLPQTICTKCLQNVNAWCEFKTACDRLQRNWFLWLKSVYGPREVVKRRIRDHARRRSLELGFWKKRKDLPAISSASRSKRPRSVVEDDCIIIDDEDNDEDSSTSTEPEVTHNSKKIRIESTHTLQALKDQAPVENGFISQDSVVAVFDEDSRGQEFDSGNSPSVQSSCENNEANEQSLQQSKDTADDNNDISIYSENNIQTIDLDDFETEPQTDRIAETEVSVEQSEPAKPSEPKVYQPRSLKQLVQKAVDVLNGKPTEETVDSQEETESTQKIWQPSRLKDIVQAFIDIMNEKPADTESECEEDVISTEPQTWQPKMLKEYVQIVLDILDGKSFGPECGPWPEDSPVYNCVEVQNIKKSSDKRKKRSLNLASTHKGDSSLTENISDVNSVDNQQESEVQKTLRVLPVHQLLESPASSTHGQRNALNVPMTDSIGDDSNSQINNDEGGDVSPSSALDDENGHQSETSNSIVDGASQVPFVRVKEEPVSDEDILYDDDYDYSVYDYAIKTEPSDSSTPMTTISAVDPGDKVSYNPWKKKIHKCTICLTKLSNEKSYLRHLNSALHRKMSSLVSTGRRVTPELKRMWASKIKSEAKIKRGGQVSTNPVRERSDSRLSLESQGETSQTSKDGIRVGNRKITSADEVVIRSAPLEGLGKCNLCNLTFKSRSLKVKHVNSSVHKLALEKLEASMRPPSMSPMKQPKPAPQPPALVKPINQPSSQMVTYTCPFAECSLSFLDGGQLIVHMHSHGISMPMRDVQDQVKKNFAIPKEVSIEPSYEAPSFKCQNCTGSFSSSGALRNHYRYCITRKISVDSSLVSEVDNELVCDICDQNCINRRSLLYHIKKWHTNKPAMHKCSKCSKVFRSKFMLARHAIIHRAVSVGKHVILCKICKRPFSKTHSLQMHLRKHFNSDKGILHCLKCLKPLRGKSEYTKHRLEGCPVKLKFFACTQCDNSYNTQDNLDVHIAECHPRDVVESSASSQLSVESVTDIFIEPGQTYCKICNKQLSNHHNYRRHMAIHQVKVEGRRTFRCRKCGLSFNNLILQRSHQCSKEDASPAASSVANDSPDEPAVSVPKPEFKIDENAPLICKYCRREYVSIRSLYDHLKRACRFRNCKCIHCGHNRNHRDTKVLCRRCRKSQRVLVEADFKKVENKVKSNPKLLSVAKTSGFTAPYAPAESGEGSGSEGQEKVDINSLIFKCPLGGRIFLSQKTLGLHASTCNGTCKDLPVYCKKCHRKYENPIIYLKHKPCKKNNSRKVRSKLSTTCEICRHTFTTRKNWWYHMTRYHREEYMNSSLKVEAPSPEPPEPYMPSMASSTLMVPQDEDLVEEVEPETPSEISNMEYQDQSAVDVSLVENSPLVSVHDVKDFIQPDSFLCPSCDHVFASASSLRKHLSEVHNGVFILVACPFCDKKTFKRELYSHGYECVMNNLPGAESLECAFCSTVFFETDDPASISAKLQFHIFNCGGKLPVKKGTLTKGKTPLLCLRCCHLFYDPATLERHMLSKHHHEPALPDVDISFPLESVPSCSKFYPEVIIDEQPPHATTSSQQADELSANRTSSGRKAVAKKRTAPAVAVALEQQNLKCKYCSRSFVSLLKLHNHEKVHGIVKKNVCLDDDF